MSNQKKNDLEAGLLDLTTSYGDKKKNGVGKIIHDAVTLPEPVDKIPVNLMIDSLYESPVEWNFFKKISYQKMMELQESIVENGLLYPIQAWKISRDEIYTDNKYTTYYDFDGETYMVLAGHNRIVAHLELYNKTGDEKYLRIPAFVYEKEELNTISAKNIIVDTNYVQRKLSYEERVKAVLWKYANYDNNMGGNKKINIARSLQMSPTSAFRYYKLGNLIYPIQKLVYDKHITINNAIKLSKCSEEVQQSLLESLTNNILGPMSSSLEEEKVIEHFNKKTSVETIKMQVSYKIPIAYVDEFKAMCDKFLESLK